MSKLVLIDKCRVSFYLCIVKIQPAKKNEHMINIARLLHSSSVLLILPSSFSSYAFQDILKISEGIAYCSYTYPACSNVESPYKYNYEYRDVSVTGQWFPSLGGALSAEFLMKFQPCDLELRADLGDAARIPEWTGGATPAGFIPTSKGRFYRKDPRDCLTAVLDLGVGIGTFSNTNMRLKGNYHGMNHSISVHVSVVGRDYDYLWGKCTTGDQYWRTCDSPSAVPNYTCSIDIPPTIDMGLIGLTTGPSEYSEQIKIQCSGPEVPNAVVLKIENETTAIGDGTLTSNLCNEQGASCSSSVTTGVNSLVVMKFIAAGFLSPGPKSGNVIVTSSYN